MKRILSFVLVVMLVFTLLPVTAQAAAGDKLVALTFDDGPHKVYTKQLLDGTAVPFAPANLSPRADIVSYLYRDFAE